VAERLYLAYTHADAEWLLSQRDVLTGEIVYSGMEPHLVFRSAGISAHDAVEIYRKLDFCAITSEADKLHRQFVQTLREVGVDYGLSFAYKGVDLLACSAHILYYFFYEAVVSYQLADVILRTYNPREVWVNQSPLAPVTHWGVDPPRINYENQVWGALRNVSIVVKPLGNGVATSSGISIGKVVPARWKQHWLWRSRRAVGAAKRRITRLLTSQVRRIQESMVRRNILRADVLFALLHPYFTENFALIGQALAGSFNLCTLDLNDDSPQLWLEWRDGLHSTLVPSMRDTGDTSEVQIGQCLDDIRFPSAFSDYPLDIWRLIRPRVDFLFRVDLPRVRAWVDRAQWIFARIRPKLIVLPEEVSLPARTLGTVARLYGAKTLVIAHGSSVSLDTRVLGKQRTDLYHWYRIYGETTPDYLAVWGPYGKRTYVEGYGWPAERIFITGWPWIERAIEAGCTDGRTTRPEAHNRPRFLFLSSATLKFPHYLYEALFQATKYFQAQLAIRPHGSEQTERLEEIARSLAADVRIDKSTPLIKQILDSDVVLGAATSVLSYAIALGKPCIFISMLELRDYLPYALEGAAIGVYEPEQLIPAIEKLLNIEHERERQREKQKAFTQQYLGPLDGKSVERIVNLVGDLLRNETN
jgi:hypothetical protein